VRCGSIASPASVGRSAFGGQSRALLPEVLYANVVPSEPGIVVDPVVDKGLVG
jgi:hypothetical protein